MATVKNSIALQDQMTPVLSKIMKSLNSTMFAMEKMNKTVSKGVVDKSFAKAQKDIQSADNALKKFNNDLSQTPAMVQKVSSGFSSWQAGIVTANQGLSLLKQGVGMASGAAKTADEYNNVNSRLALINDGTQTQVQLEKKVYQAAQRSLGAYNDTAATVSKLGLVAKDKFKGNDEMISFAETLNKSFVVGGASAQEMATGTYQLSQAMAAGRLQGDEFRAVMETAPMVAQAIANYTGVGMEGLKEMSSQGLITADIIKNSLMGASADIEKQFQSMSVTFGQIMTMMKNYAQKAFAPVMKGFSKILSSNEFQAFIEMIANGLMFLGSIAQNVGQTFIAFTKFVIANKVAFIALSAIISIVLIPILWGVIAPYIAIKIAAIKAGLASMKAAIMAAKSWILTMLPLMLVIASIAILIMVWDKLGVVGQAVGIVIVIALILIQLAALGVTFPILIIIGLILVVAAGFIFFGDIATMVLGKIVGGVYWLGAVFHNVGMGIANGALFVAEFFVNAWNNGIYNVQMLFYNLQMFIFAVLNVIIEDVQGMVDTIGASISKVLNFAITGLNELISIYNKLPFDDISAVGEITLQTKGDWSDGIESKAAALQAPEMKAPADFGRHDYMDLSDQFSKGEQIGIGAGNAVTGAIEGISGRIKGGTGKFGELGESIGDMSNLPAGAGAGGGNPLQEGGNVSEVGKIGSDISMSDEDLKYMRDIAKVDYINKYTTLTPNISVNFGDVHETADVDALMGAIETMTNDAYASVLVGG